MAPFLRVGLNDADCVDLEESTGSRSGQRMKNVIEAVRPI